MKIKSTQSYSWQGISYTPNAEGELEVPKELAEALGIKKTGEEVEEMEAKPLDLQPPATPTEPKKR